MTTIMALLASIAAMPSCPAPVGVPVAITSTPLQVESLGGLYQTDTGWPAPGDARVGQLRYDWGVMLRSNDSRFTDLDYDRGAVHSRASGCWFEWDSAWNAGNVTGVSNGRIGRAAFRDDYIVHEPADPPHIPGYRFIGADEVHSAGYAWIGVWTAEGSTERSQVVVYNGERHTVLATLPVRIGGMTMLPDLHSSAYHLTLIGTGKPNRSIPWIRLIWSGTTMVQPVTTGKDRPHE